MDAPVELTQEEILFLESLDRFVLSDDYLPELETMSELVEVSDDES